MNPLPQVMVNTNRLIGRLTLVTFLLAAWSGTSRGQDHARVRADTLSLSQSLISDKKFDEASLLLTDYLQAHSSDFNATWMLAQTEYWRKNFSRSIQLYEKAMVLQPSNAYLQLDFARVLINSGRYQKAQNLLMKLKTFDVTREASMFELAKCFYWQRNNLKAKEEAVSLLKLYPNNEAAKRLLDDISFSLSPWANISTGYTSDTQPLQTLTPVFETGVALSKMFAPYVGVYRPTFFYNGNVAPALQVLAGNQFSLSKGPTLKLEGGMVKFPFNNGSKFIGKMQATQKISKSITLDLLDEKKPYFNTLKSVDTSITVNHFFASLDLNRENGPLGRIAFDDNHFFDGNDVYSVYGYLLLKPISLLGSQLRLGYSFAFNDSRENRFVPRDPLSAIVTEGYPIAGIYNPYFTPQRQSINSIVGSWLIPFSKTVKLGVNTNVGFYATTYNPYFYLQRKNPNTYMIIKDYALIKYTPWDVSTYLQWQPSAYWTIRADYQHKSTFFFESNYVGLSIRTVLSHGR